MEIAAIRLMLIRNVTVRRLHTTGTPWCIRIVVKSVIAPLQRRVNAMITGTVFDDSHQPGAGFRAGNLMAAWPHTLDIEGRKCDICSRTGNSTRFPVTFAQATQRSAAPDLVGSSINGGPTSERNRALERVFGSADECLDEGSSTRRVLTHIIRAVSIHKEDPTMIHAEQQRKLDQLVREMSDKR